MGIRSIVISLPRLRPTNTDDAATAMCLEGGLVHEQLIARLGHELIVQNNHFEIHGVLAYYQESWDVLASAPMRRVLANAELARADVRVRTAPAVAFDGETYCGPRARGDLELVCDPICGMPPLRLAASGAYVASHRLRLSGETQNQMWMWDTEYRHIYMMWLTSSGYESWAARELSRRDSALNKAGRELARRVAKDTGRKVGMPAYGPYEGA